VSCTNIAPSACVILVSQVEVLSSCIERAAMCIFSRRHSVVVPYKPPEFASSFGACVCCVSIQGIWEVRAHLASSFWL
jgi:hypothetical protein